MIIIVGASRGIGKYLFDNLSVKNKVVGTYNSTCDNVQEGMYRVDITDMTSVAGFYESIKDQADNLILINCAGISYNSFTHKSDPLLWRKVIEVNLIGVYNVIRVFLPLMRDQNYGRIINFSSVVAQKPTPGVGAYAASKSALWGMTKSIAAENASKGITINNINLGYANIGMGVNDVPPEFAEKIVKEIPSGRFCEPQEITTCVEFLIDNQYINGSSIDLSGGIV